MLKYKLYKQNWQQMDNNKLEQLNKLKRDAARKRVEKIIKESAYNLTSDNAANLAKADAILLKELATVKEDQGKIIDVITKFAREYSLTKSKLVQTVKDVISKAPKDGVNGKDGSPDTPADIVSKLESIKEEEEKLSPDAIKGWHKTIGDLRRLAGRTTTQITSAGFNLFKNGIRVGNPRQRINFIEGSNITITATESADTERFDVTIASSGSGGDGTVTQVDTTAPITGGPITTTGTIGITQADTDTDGYLSSTDWNTFNSKGSGDFSSNTSTSVDGEVVVFSGTGGKTGKRATGTGLAKLTSGVLGTATSGTDYAPATSGTSILKGDGSGGFANASAGTDYEVPLTFSTGLTRSTNTVTVNTSQNIATLSNLTSNGYVKTSGGNGTLGIQAVPIPIADGGTNATTATNARTQLGLAIGTDVQAFDSDLSALAANTTNGLWARTGTGTGSARTIAGTANEVTLTNGDGVSGNPTVSLPSALTFTGKTITGGTYSSPLFSGTIDGWVASGETWTYASQSQFTVSGDVTSKYPKGTKIKLTNNGSTKYNFVTGTSFGGGNTTVSMSDTSDYTLANSAITDPYYSLAANPVGFPTTFSFIPVWTSTGTQPSIGNGSISGKYILSEKTIEVNISFTAGSTTTFGTGSYRFSFGVGMSTTVSPVATCRLLDSGTAYYTCIGTLASSTSIALQRDTSGDVGATSPMTWANGDGALITLIGALA